MEEQKSPPQVTKKRAASIVFWIFSALFGVLIVLFLFLQLTFFQTFIAQKALEKLSEITNHRIGISKLRIQWIDEIVLEGVEIRDQKDSLMIGVERVFIDFNIFDMPFQGEYFTIDAARITNPQVHLIKYQDSSLLNINEFIASFAVKKDTSKVSKPFKILISRLKLDDGLFSYNDQRQDSITGQLDYYHFSIANLAGNFSTFILEGSRLLLGINNLSGNETAGYINIKNLVGNLDFQNTSLVIDKLDLTTDYSRITDKAALYYRSPGNLSYFNDSVEFKFQFDKTIINPKDLAAFAPQIKGATENVGITGTLEGSVKRLRSENIRVNIGESSFLSGRMYMSGLPDISETFMDLKVNDGYLIPSDLKPYIKSNYNMVQGVGPVAIKGQFMGFVNDFVANGTFNTKTGFVKSDINIKIPKDFRATQYKGNLTLSNFDLSSVLQNEKIFQNINMVGTISGSGITLDRANFFMDALITSVGINGYNYKNIQTKGNFASQFFKGDIAVSDENLRISGNGTADFRPKSERLLADISIDTIALLPINLYHEPISGSAKIAVDIENFTIDSIIGNLNIKDLTFSKGKDVAKVNLIAVTSTRKNNYRLVTVDSDLFDLDIGGEFLFTDLTSDVIRLYQEYRLNIENNSEDINNYYKKKPKTPNIDYNVSLDLTVKKPNQFINVFNKDLRLGSVTSVSGKFKHGNTSIFSLYSEPDTLFFADNGFFNNEMEFTLSKIADSTAVLGMALLASKEQTWHGITETKNSYLEAIWSGPIMDFMLNMEQKEINNYAKVTGNINFLQDTTIIHFQPSDLLAFDKKWQFSNENEIEFTNNEIFINNLRLFSDDEYLYVNGILSDSIDKKTELQVSNFDLQNIQPFITKNMRGVVNGTVLVSDIYKARSIESDIDVSGFHFDNFLVGDIRTASKWEDEDKRFRLGLDVHRKEKKVIDIVGYFIPKDTTEQLSLVAELDDARLNILQPFIEETFTRLDGSVDGLFVIKGNLNEPILKGRGIVKNGTALVNYLNTFYQFEGEVLFDQNEIGVRDLNLKDVDGNTAKANGGIFHDGFKNFVLDLNGQMNNFQVLNTASKDNDLYYGTAYVTGSLAMLGSFSNLTINATATSAKGTKLYIPLSSQTLVEQEDFISFVNFSQNSTSEDDKKDEKPTIDLSGIKLDFDLDITPDAYCEIIFDIKSGDIIRGRGNGNLKLQIDTKGDFNMFGDFEIVSGAYNFTLYNIINKEFSIKNGSRISWFGDPYQGVLNINATYRQLAALTPLMTTLDEETLAANELRRKYPAIVELKLDGPMLSPSIGFGIDFNDYPDNILLPNGTLVALNALVSGFKSRILADEQELKRQVFSLIILRRLSPENSFTVAGGQALESSVSEFVSNQLSYWITQVDENLEIDVDLNSLDSDALNTFQLRLAYTFFDGRLRVSRGGGFTNSSNQSDFNSILGDWSLEYLLTPDGKFRAKMFNRIDQNAFNSLNNNSNQTGFSLQYIRSFDQLEGILKDAKKRESDPKTDTKLPIQKEALNLNQ